MSEADKEVLSKIEDLCKKTKHARKALVHILTLELGAANVKGMTVSEVVDALIAKQSPVVSAVKPLFELLTKSKRELSSLVQNYIEERGTERLEILLGIPEYEERERRIAFLTNEILIATTAEG